MVGTVVAAASSPWPVRTKDGDRCRRTLPLGGFDVRRTMAGRRLTRPYACQSGHRPASAGHRLWAARRPEATGGRNAEVAAELPEGKMVWQLTLLTPDGSDILTVLRISGQGRISFHVPHREAHTIAILDYV